MNNMIIRLQFCYLLLLPYVLQARQNSVPPAPYHPASTLVNDLLHTKLEARFNYDKAYMYGKAWLTLRPHFYETDSVQLDARGMAINKITLDGRQLQYHYDNHKLCIALGKRYNRHQRYTIFVDYVAKPDELKTKGGAPEVLKGLYFINPTGAQKDKPVQIWTQGEPQATSVWCPTIDQPNQKSTQEFFITVPGKYVTLSNGVLVRSKKNPDGTHTDYWKMDLPNSPYLFFMAAGEFAIVKDNYRGKEVCYYVEKKYEKTARRIFGDTPEMMAFFSGITGVEYPWPKYAQIAVKDFTSGGMENTSASMLHENVQQNERELADGNAWENAIAHELFHQWFGNYVTAESWSNISLGESFARYGESLWSEYKHGRDKADEILYNCGFGYLHGPARGKSLVRYHYAYIDELFDAVSYDKGARILHMLRQYVGDRAFSRSLQLYLTDNKYKPAEVHQLRLAFEEVTGKDLNWFFDQWFFGDAHPKLAISYDYSESGKQVSIILKQEQEGHVFRLPMNIDIFTGSQKIRYPVEVTKKEQVFVFPCESKPSLVNVDAEKVILCERKDPKSIDNLVHQYKYAGNYASRREAIELVVQQQDDPRVVDLLVLAARDTCSGLRFHALQMIDFRKEKVKQVFEPVVAAMAVHEKDVRVRSKAVMLLGAYNDKKYLPLFNQALNDASYTVAAEALQVLSVLDPAVRLKHAQRFKKEVLRGRLADVVLNILAEEGSEEDFEFIVQRFEGLPMSFYKLDVLKPFAVIVGKVADPHNFKRGVDAIIRFRDDIPDPYREQVVPLINNVYLKGIVDNKKTFLQNGNAQVMINEQIKYINERLNAQ